jgi:hypothetical protein
MAIRFEASVLTIGDRPIVRLPHDASAQLPSRGQVAANGALNGQSFSTVLEPDGAKGHWLEVDDRMSPLAASEGDTVTIELEPTKVWPEPTVPHDLQAALDDAPDLAGQWADITPMARWEWVRWVNATKNPETRARRVEVSISKLRGGSRRPCCFDLTSCTDPELAKNGKLLGIV